MDSGFAVLDRSGFEGGSISGNASQLVPQGLSGTLVTAVPAEGYVFLRWSDGLTTAYRIERKVQADLTVTALFEKLEDPQEPPSDRFSDISDAEWLSSYGVTTQRVCALAQGYGDGRFGPSDPVSRGQFAKMALAGFALPTAHPALPTFSDVPPEHIF